MTYAMHPFTLHHPSSVEEALSLAADHPGALYLAGGTDLMVNLRKRLHEPHHVVNLAGIEGMRGVAREGDRLTIGALTTIETLATHPLVREHLPVLAGAAALVAGPTLRGMGTLGGNLCLDTRCRYYNQSHFWRQANDFCLKKDGDVCHVAPGGSFCWATYSGDTAPALLAYDAELDLAGPEGENSGERTVALNDFYGPDGRWSIGEEPGGRRPGELLLRVRMPLPESDPESGWEGCYEKLRVRDSIDFPQLGLATRLLRRDGKLEAIRMALTAVNPRPMVVAGLEEFSGRVLDLALVDDLKRKANKTGKPMRTAVADTAYRRTMIGALVEKAIERLVPELAEPLAERRRLD